MFGAPPTTEPTYIEPQSPPSSYAVAAALDGEDGAWPRVLGVTLARAVIIFPGLYLGGVRGRHLFTGALAASASITGMLFVAYGIRKSAVLGRTR